MLPRVSRLPRFRRSPDKLPAIQVTVRDREIIRHVAQHRFLRSSQIVALVGGSAQQVLRRLHRLYHHAYLDRPRSQLTYFHQGGSQAIVYALGGKGARLLAEHGERQLVRNDWENRNQNVKQFYLQHALLIADVMLAVQQSCAVRPQIRFLSEKHLAEQTGLRDPFRWSVRTKSRELGVRPDNVFALENTQTGHRSLFFVEADRATMPAIRHSLNRSSFYRKLIAYQATWAQGIHSTRFGFNRFRVLTVTTSKTRVNNLAAVCQRLERGHGLFLFTNHHSLLQADLFAPIWRTAQNETRSALEDFEM